MKLRRNAAFVGALLMVGAAATPLVGGYASAAAKTAKAPIIIGAAVAKTGWMTVSDQTTMEAFMMEINSVNKAGGINGHQLKVISEDTQTNVTKDKQVTSDLIRRGAKIIIGTCNFDVGSPIGITAEQHGLLNMSLCAGSPLWGPKGIGPLAYSGATADYVEGWVMAQFMKNQGYKDPFVLNDTSLDYSKEVCTGFTDHWAQLGGKLAGTDTFLNSDANIATQVGDIQTAKPDAIALCTYSPGGPTAVRDIRAAGLSTPIVSDFGMTGTSWLSAVPNLSDFFVTSNASLYHDDQVKAVNQFVTAYTKQFGSSGLQNTSVVDGYADAQMIVAALKATGGSTSGTKLAAAMNQFHNLNLLLPTTFTKTVHIQATRPVRILEYTNGRPSFFKLIVPRNVNLHL